MPLTSQQFIAALDPQRDALYARARRAADNPRAAESRLLSAACRAFSTMHASGKSDAVAAVLDELPAAVSNAELAETDACMPADTWARLTAAVQIAAAKTAGTSALNPDHVLLTPDPLLAPKQHKRVSEPLEGLGFTPTSRFLIAAIVALLLGLILTTIILTRHSSAPTAVPTTQR